MALFRNRKLKKRLTRLERATLTEEEQQSLAKERRVQQAAQTRQSFLSLFQGISGRWLTFSLVLVATLFLLFSIAVYFIAHAYFYNTVDRQLAAQYTDAVSSYFSSYIGGTEETFEEGAYGYVSSFTGKDQMSVWVINADGEVVVSSSGFDIESPDIPDFYSALSSTTNSATYSGKNTDGEHIRSATYLLAGDDGEAAGAVRYIISTEGIRAQLRWIMGAMLALFFIIAVFVIFLSMYFVRSIVNPVRDLNEVTKKIAAGDMDARATPSDVHDEISELAVSINQMAEEITSTDKMKNDFISTVSHEMKTPLTAIKGWAETLMAIGDTDQAMTQRGLEVIVDETTRLTGVVEDLLDLSKIVNGRLTLKYTKIDLLAELDDTIFVFKDRSMRENIELVYNVPTVPAPAQGDAARIKQVFVNVLDNAFKYNHEGGKITVYAELHPPVNGEDLGALIVQVEDTGCGISKEELPKVKKKFYKSNISVKGSGIGLAVCDEIVKMHHGSLELESEVGVGTCVTITLPVEYTAPEEEDFQTVLIQEMENNQLEQEHSNET